MNCVENQELLSAYFDGELPLDDSALVKLHLEGCKVCRLELDQFDKLSWLASDLEIPSVPASVWSEIVCGLGRTVEDSISAVAEVVKTFDDPRNEPKVLTTFATRRRVVWAAAIAATLLVGIVGWSFWDHFAGHDHHAMVAAMGQIAVNPDSDVATDLLRNKFGGQQVSFDDAVTLVGYRPVAATGLPEGYTVESVQVLDMPCCRCAQTACRRSDNSRFFIYEHENDETGWFDDKTRRQCKCGSKECQVTELENQLVATWQKDNRHITIIGVRDEAEIELLADAF